MTARRESFKDVLVIPVSRQNASATPQGAGGLVEASWADDGGRTGISSTTIGNVISALQQKKSMLRKTYQLTCAQVRALCSSCLSSCHTGCWVQAGIGPSQHFHSGQPLIPVSLSGSPRFLFYCQVLPFNSQRCAVPPARDTR